jgi:hypothetical protein
MRHTVADYMRVPRLGENLNAMQKFRKLVYAALAVATLVLWTPAGRAQNFRGRIEGLVTDQSGGVIANASVTLTNVDTNIRTIRQTSGTGLYVFDNVDPGNYSVSVELAGFNKFLQENILLQANGDVTVNVGMKTGSVADDCHRDRDAPIGGLRLCQQGHDIGYKNGGGHAAA